MRRPFAHDLSRMDFWLPVVGLPVAFLVWGSLALFSIPLGLLAAGILAGAPATGFTAWLPGVGALLILCIQYFAFNLFHFDGLLDTADAFLGAGDKERKLAILKDSRIGVYAFFVGFVYLAAKLAFLALVVSVALESAGLMYGRMSGSTSTSTLSGTVPISGTIALRSQLGFLVAFFAYPLAGRLAAALIPCILPSARPGGLGSLALGSRPGRALMGAGIALFVYLCIGLPLISSSGLPVRDSAWLTLAICIILPLAALAALAFVVRVYRKGVGGYTGDALGAAVELGELVHMAIVCLSFFVVASLV